MDHYVNYNHIYNGIHSSFNWSSLIYLICLKIEAFKPTSEVHTISRNYISCVLKIYTYNLHVLITSDYDSVSHKVISS